MATFDKIANLEISLPVTEEEVPDWDYMQRYIAELEQYLIAAGLDDYTLTEEDESVLALDAKMEAFQMEKIFTKLDLKCKRANFEKRRDTSTQMSMEFNLPLVNAKHGDNGIQYYGRAEEWESAAMTICVVSNGAIATGDVYAEPQTTGVLWDAYLLKPNFNDITTRMLFYMACAIEKAIKLVFAWDNKAVWNKVKHINVFLPIQTSPGGEPILDDAKTYHPEGFVPDWDYMAAYIRAIEKIVVRDVVDFKNEQLAKTREFVSAKQA